MEVIRQVSAVMSLTITDMQIYSEGKIEDLSSIGIEYLTLFDFQKLVTVTNNCHSRKYLGLLDSSHPFKQQM